MNKELTEQDLTNLKQTIDINFRYTNVFNDLVIDKNTITLEQMNAYVDTVERLWKDISGKLAHHEICELIPAYIDIQEFDEELLAEQDLPEDFILNDDNQSKLINLIDADELLDFSYDYFQID